MKRITLILFVLVLSLAACAAPATPPLAPEDTSAPVDTNMPVPGVSVTEVVVEPQGKLPAGERASQVLLLSAPEIADLQTLPEGATLVAVVVNQWDPKNDLAAFVYVRKTAWEASGFTILDEEPLTLDLGLAAVRFTVQTTDGVTVLFQFAAVGDQYLTISGEGDLALVEEIMTYLRPLNMQ